MKKYEYNVRVRLNESITGRMNNAKIIAITAITGLTVLGGSLVPLGVRAQGGSGGGSTPVTTAPVLPIASTCAVITGFSNTTGYYSIWSAIWTKFSIANSCNTPLNWEMTFTNNNTGLVEFSRATSTIYMTSGVIDYDWGQFSTPYTVKLTLTDANGSVVTSQSGLIISKKDKSLGL